MALKDAPPPPPSLHIKLTCASDAFILLAKKKRISAAAAGKNCHLHVQILCFFASCILGTWRQQQLQY